VPPLAWAAVRAAGRGHLRSVCAMRSPVPSRGQSSLDGYLLLCALLGEDQQRPVTRSQPASGLGGAEGDLSSLTPP
jgi:hypothetical protein